MNYFSNSVKYLKKIKYFQCEMHYGATNIKNEKSTANSCSQYYSYSTFKILMLKINKNSYTSLSFMYTFILLRNIFFKQLKIAESQNILIQILTKTFMHL